MDDWGRDPDVALFVGGPKHGDIEDIGKTQIMRMTDTEDIYSWGSVAPKNIVVRDWTYVRGGVYIPKDNVKVTVMYDQSLRLDGVMQAAESEWYFWQNWKTGGKWLTRPGSFFSWTDPLPDLKKTPEEALAWLHNGTGKDFL